MAQVGVVQFSTRFTRDIALFEHRQSRSRLAAAVRAIPWHNAGTHIGEGVDYALKFAFGELAGDRVCSPDVLVVITDGKDDGAVPFLTFALPDLA